MKMNRALINYVKLLEEKERELQEKLDIYELMLDGGVSWSFPFFEPDSKEDLKKLLNYIRKTNLPSLTYNEKYIKYLKTGKADAKKELEKCLEKTNLSMDNFFEEVEIEQKILHSYYAELIELIEIMME